MDRHSFELIGKIADRVENELPLVASQVRRSTLVMDLDNAHEHMPLDLTGLLEAPRGDFSHDVVGIINHMDRQTFKLTGCFVPRFAYANRG